MNGANDIEYWVISSRASFISFSPCLNLLVSAGWSQVEQRKVQAAVKQAVEPDFMHGPQCAAVKFCGNELKPEVPHSSRANESSCQGLSGFHEKWGSWSFSTNFHSWWSTLWWAMVDPRLRWKLGRLLLGRRFGGFQRWIAMDSMGSQEHIRTHVSCRHW